jgi:hypothetical protein
MIIFKCQFCGKEYDPDMAVMTDCPSSPLWKLHNLEAVTVEIPADLATL